MKIPALFFEESFWCEKSKTSYMRGTYTPKSVEEYTALKGFAQQPVPELEEDEKANLLEKAKTLGLNPDGRWSVDRLKDEIQKANAATERAQRKELMDRAVAMNLDPKDLAQLSNEELAAKLGANG